MKGKVKKIRLLHHVKEQRSGKIMKREQLLWRL